MSALRIGITTGNGEFGFIVWFRYILVVASWTLMVVTFPFSFIFSVKVIPEYKRAVVFRLGRILPGGARGPGLVFVTPCLDRIKMVDLRLRTFNLPMQECLTKDAIEMKLETVLYYRVTNPVSAVTNIEDADHHTQYICAAVLRNTLSGATLHQLLSERDMLKRTILERLDELTLSWGVKVERIEIKDIRLPAEMKQAMTKEAETARQANAKVISAEGEKAAMFALADGARMIASSPYGMQLHYLHTLSHLVTVPNPARDTTLVFPVPFDFNGMSNFGFANAPFDLAAAMPPSMAVYQPNLAGTAPRQPPGAATKPLSVSIPPQAQENARRLDEDEQERPAAHGSAANNSTSDSNNNHELLHAVGTAAEVHRPPRSHPAANDRFPAEPPSPSPPPPPSSAPSSSSLSSLASAASAARSGHSSRLDASGSNAQAIRPAAQHPSRASSSMHSTSQAATECARKEMIDLTAGHHNALPSSPPPTIIPLSNLNLQTAVVQGGMLLQPIGVGSTGVQNLAAMGTQQGAQPTSVYIVNMQQQPKAKTEAPKNSSVSTV